MSSLYRLAHVCLIFNGLCKYVLKFDILSKIQIIGLFAMIVNVRP